MTNMLATLFINPMMFSRHTGLLLLLPLCLAISVVYKTIKIEDLRKVPAAVVASWLTVIFGMFALCLAVYLLYNLAA